MKEKERQRKKIKRHGKNLKENKETEKEIERS
jgi:hypothetical protein